jgi:hypothetical protein
MDKDGLVNEDAVSLGLSLLDRQLVDVNDRECGNVDDLEFEFPSDAESGSPPIVSFILTGPGALGTRLWGSLGTIARALWKRFHPELDPQPIRISFASVVKIDYEVRLNLDYHEAGLDVVDDWVRERIIEKIPGAS